MIMDKVPKSVVQQFREGSCYRGCRAFLIGSGGGQEFELPFASNIVACKCLCCITTINYEQLVTRGQL